MDRLGRVFFVLQNAEFGVKTQARERENLAALGCEHACNQVGGPKWRGLCAMADNQGFKP
jgi:hypothetical protein